MFSSVAPRGRFGIKDMGPVKKLGVVVEEVYEIEHGLIAVLHKMMIYFDGYLVFKLKCRRESEPGYIFA